jgi:hypothetical protein
MSHGFPRRLRKDRHRKPKPTSATKLELPLLKHFSTSDLIADITERSARREAFTEAIAELAAPNQN